MKRLITLLLTSAMLIAVGACGDDDEDDTKHGNGVNDVRQACVVRSAWTKTDQKCLLCEAAVLSPECGCEALKDFSAYCIDQAQARKAACPTSDTIDVCVNKCAKPDCDCIDHCYDGQDACKKASAARDGCAAAVCDQFCK
jgi:hypothetical protein